MEMMRIEPFVKSKNGSVFPKKRKLVKSMVFASLIQSLASLCSSCFYRGAANKPSCLKKSSPPKVANVAD
ncbi:hypothetical protein JCGZ_12175 [Jatropha curcas]|uniref:Uncharacterized protein n=1 Tax=Jatropha curcas TaxID=180498 RepID=A0A067KCZ1_JATCU|nr:hypothetical protein JCGZ_12175 [Jatropha curcas]